MQKSLKNISALSILGGIILFIFLYLSSIFITSRITPINLRQIREFYFLIALIGISTGHYLGLALTKEKKLITQFLLGFFGSISFFLFLKLSITIESGILISGAALLIILHKSGIIENHKTIELWINRISNYGTGIALATSVFFNYIIPFMATIIKF